MNVPGNASVHKVTHFLNVHFLLDIWHISLEVITKILSPFKEERNSDDSFLGSLELRGVIFMFLQKCYIGRGGCITAGVMVHTVLIYLFKDHRWS